MHDITPTLRSLGLLESEVKVYLAALEGGPSTVIDLAGATRLSRPATYTAIETLTERGLMSTVQAGKKRLFSAEHPDRLLQYAKRRESELAERVADLERALPDLALRVGGEKPIVKSFEGKEGIQAIIEDIREARPQRIDEITNVDAMRAVLAQGELQPIRQELERIGTKVRGLYAGSNLRPSLNTDARVLPERLRHFKGNISVSGKRIAIITFTGKLHSIMIESEDLADTLRTLFDLAWETAKEFPKPGTPAT